MISNIFYFLSIQNRLLHRSVKKVKEAETVWSLNPVANPMSNNSSARLVCSYTVLRLLCGYKVLQTHVVADTMSVFPSKYNSSIKLCPPIHRQQKNYCAGANKNNEKTRQVQVSAPFPIRGILTLAQYYLIRWSKSLSVVTNRPSHHFG